MPSQTVDLLAAREGGEVLALVETEGLGDHVRADPAVLEHRGLVLTGRLNALLAEVLPLLERVHIREGGAGG